MKKIVKLTESDLTRIVKHIINEVTGTEVKVTPKIPGNLGFQLQDSPIGEVVSWKTGKPDSTNPIANTNLVIKPEAKIKVVKKGQIQIEGFLYFRMGKAKKGEKSVFGGQGPESTQAILGKAIPKTIWYDCATSTFYVWYDSNKVVFSFYGTPKSNKFTETKEWIGKTICGYATQDEMLAQFKD
jgi:hypothetical protein